MLDNEIDRAAEQLTAGEPSVDLRARVFAGIEARRDREKVRGWIKVAVPAGAVIVAGLIVQHVEQVQHVQRSQAVQRAQTVAEVHEPKQARTVAGIPNAQPVLANKRVTPMDRSTAVNPDSAPDDAIDPIAIEPVVVAALSLAAPIVIDALSTEPIRIDEIELPELAQ